ncbi:putative low-density lipoprotein receptor-related protein 2-like [Scophthalmus maximus]|uniref:Putative low-density lipoprotein receptor-related protein 2-like n=1 Tax=Scophthalmus maximus TaxID=52904 RepID=A0A2U9CEP1_SCOMX|nr:putative low-density lipoprotein receptor-related protein 2-like [Scophthalmus maximus]
MTLWDRRGGSPLQDIAVRGRVVQVTAALGDVGTVPSSAVCSEPSVLCRNSPVCLSQAQLCDGKQNCPEGDDEEFCVTACPSNEDFKCKDRSRCIGRNLICDGFSHCRDGSDEVDCPTVAPPAAPTKVLRCRIGSKPCSDGTECVLFSHVCDGEKDCKDGSDELGCDATPTSPDIPPSTTPPAPTLPACSSPSVLCPSVHLCISPSQFCDGRNDCPDGFDEINCVKRCPTRNDFRCKDRRSCVSKSLVCDGRSHCLDGSDEVDCPAVVAPAVAPAARANVRKCRMGSRLCRDGTECVLFSHVCDGERDCRDGSDEEGCETVSAVPAENRLNKSPAPVEPFPEPPPKPTCTSPSVLCAGSSSCIKPTQMCDGKRDCPDGSDEQCVKKCPYKTDFRCKDRRSCVSKSLVCDGRSHCFDGSDEVDCPAVVAPAVAPAALANVLKCRLGSRLCRDGTECVLFSHVCDGERDCRDGSDEEGCGVFVDRLSASTRHSAEFLCKDRRSCVSKSLVCDGRAQCHDGSDEVNCLTVSTPASRANAVRCRVGARPCNDGTGCVLYSHVCDGEDDCADGSDEQGCQETCRQDEFQCAHGKMCIPRAQVCDGTSQCRDQSDELDCWQKTKSCEYRCADGKRCIPKKFLCDGERDCLDGTDEVGCACKAPSVLCPGSSLCISQNQLCDAHRDCPDGFDESDCVLQCERQASINALNARSAPLKCRKGFKPCRDGLNCVMYSHVCDGEKDCQDGSDEDGCAAQCKAGEFQCSHGNRCIPPEQWSEGCQRRCDNNTRCIPETFLCDGERDCADGSDEEKCGLVACAINQYRCTSGQCVSEALRCDGYADCSDHSDEMDCKRPPRCATRLRCPHSHECLQKEWLCDGEDDCKDGSDEKNCVTPPAKCMEYQWQCGDSSSQRKCPSHLYQCGSGFRLQSSAASCADIDECTATPYAVCKHTCLNNRGSYVCHCHPGFYQEPDKSCKTKDEPLLLASVQSELLLLGVHNGNLRLLSSANRPVFSLDYHWTQQRVYWLSPDYQSIRWADMKDSNKKGTLVKGVKSDFIAVDWVGKNLYWVDGLVGQILAVKLSNATVSSQNYTVVLGEDLEQPSSLVLLPHRGLMLWSGIGRTPLIERSGMDGSKRKVVVKRGLSWPVGLAVDLLDNRVYWADEKLRCIGSASLDGDNVKILQLAETPSPFSVAVFNDRVFWSDTKRRTIRSADKNSGKDQKVLLKRPGQPFGLKLMHALSQPAVSSPCDHLRCSHLCLLAPAVRGRSGAPGSPGAPVVRGLMAVCRCPKGLLLSKDRITCSLPAESTFILLLSRTTVYQIYLHSMHQDGVALKTMPNSRVLALPGVTEAVGLDVSIHELSMYVADAAQGSVDVLKLSGPRSRQGLTPAGQVLKLKDDTVTALAVDWVTSSFYWSSTVRPDLHVTSRHDGYTTSLLQGSLRGTTSIALHPPSGRLCYTAIAGAGEASQTEVNCAWMDGRTRAVLWRKSVVPTSLVFSNKGAMIYWADTGEGVISSIGVDGSGYKQYKTGPGFLISFTHTENFLLWVTLDKDVAKLWFSDGLQPKQLWFETKTSLVEVKAYSNSSQSGTNSCSNDNGDCVHLCLPYPGGRTCKCGQGFYSTGATSCAPLPDCPDGERSCGDGTKCVRSSMFCDGHADCADQSDEQDCPNHDKNDVGPKDSDDLLPRSSSPRSNDQNEKNSVEVTDSCDLQHCNGHGSCLTDGKVTRCQCAAGYSGEFCQEAESGQSHVGVVLGVFCLVAALMAATLIFAKRRAWASIRRRSTEKETLMANMGLPCEHYDSDSEELESPVDAKNPPLLLKSLQNK